MRYSSFIQSDKFARGAGCLEIHLLPPVGQQARQKPPGQSEAQDLGSQAILFPKRSSVSPRRGLDGCGCVESTEVTRIADARTKGDPRFTGGPIHTMQSEAPHLHPTHEPSTHEPLVLERGLQSDPDFVSPPKRNEFRSPVHGPSARLKCRRGSPRSGTCLPCRDCTSRRAARK